MNHVKILCFSLFLLPFWMQGVQAQEISYTKLVIQKGKSFTLHTSDTSGSLLIDTLIMEDRSQIQLWGKTEFTILAKNAYIGHNCLISGQDGQNNGTNFQIQMRLVSLDKLYIVACGRNRQYGNPDYPNGDGGDVHFFYTEDGLIPQTDRPRQNRYLSVNVQGAEGSLNPASDISILKSQINQGGRVGNALPGLRQGIVYEASPGENGDFELGILNF